MSRTRFKNIVKNRILVNALDYLQSKRGSKGQEITYTTLEMSEYLLPFNSKLDLEEKRQLFAVRNRMVKIPSNYGQKEEKCECGSKENLEHIYSCLKFNKSDPEIPYDQIYNGNLNTQIKIFRRIQKCLESRNQTKEIKAPCDLSDPPNYMFGFG